MIDRGRIGHRTAPTSIRIDAWRVKLFCQAIGETDPVHWDEGAARAAGHRGSPVPPTFLKALEGEHLGGIELLRLLGAPLRGVLHAGQAFEWLAPLHVGDDVEISREVVDIRDKKDGAMTFIVVDTRYSIRGEVVATSRQTIVVRNEIVPA
jgi:acyl dehydratase